jgi:hypothetical protein
MRLTPRLFQVLERRVKQEHTRQELLFGILTANVVNSSMNRPDYGAHPRDFMPSMWNREEPTEEQTLEELRNALMRPVCR